MTARAYAVQRMLTTIASDYASPVQARQGGGSSVPMSTTKVRGLAAVLTLSVLTACGGAAPTLPPAPTPATSPTPTPTTMVTASPTTAPTPTTVPTPSASPTAAPTASLTPTVEPSVAPSLVPGGSDVTTTVLQQRIAAATDLLCGPVEDYGFGCHLVTPDIDTSVDVRSNREILNSVEVTIADFTQASVSDKALVLFLDIAEMVNAPDLAEKQAWLRANIDKNEATKTFGNAEWRIITLDAPGYRLLTITYIG